MGKKSNAAKEAAQIRTALRWTDDTDIAPDVLPPTSRDELTTGWTFNAHSRRVDVACSSVISHAIGRTDKTTAQQPIRLFSTRVRALRALRVALEREFAAELAKIDGLLAETPESVARMEDKGDTACTAAEHQQAWAAEIGAAAVRVARGGAGGSERGVSEWMEAVGRG